MVFIRKDCVRRFGKFDLGTMFSLLGVLSGMKVLLGNLRIPGWFEEKVLIGLQIGLVEKVEGKRCSLWLGITQDRGMWMCGEGATNAKSMRKKGPKKSIFEMVCLVAACCS